MADGFTLNAKIYDGLKWIALVLLPALGSLYFGLGAIWHFQAVEQVVGTITLIDTFLGLLITRTSGNHTEKQVVGDLVVKQDQFGAVSGMKLVANKDPLILPDQERVVFEVKREVHME